MARKTVAQRAGLGDKIRTMKSEPNPADQNHLHALKTYELESAIAALDDPFTGKDLLEIGSGTGYQLSLLANRCKSVNGIDLADSSYAQDRLMPVIDYDGTHIPFPDRTFDVIFSSSVLEHIRDVSGFHAEMHRVLKDDGVAVHIVPTHNWRIWTSLAHYPALPKTVLSALKRGAGGRAGTNGRRGIASKIGAVLFPPRHGERGNAFTEIFDFRPSQWERQFTQNNWTVERSGPTGLFQTGHCLFGLTLNTRVRAGLAKFLGSACRTFLLTKRREA